MDLVQERAPAQDAERELSAAPAEVPERAGAEPRPTPDAHSAELTESGRAPKLYRSRSGRVIAGVSAGLAEHLGVRVLWVRIAFALLCVLSGAGLFAYGLLWMFVPQGARSDTEPDVSATERQQAFGVLALAVGLTVAGGMLSGVFSGWMAGPLALAVLGAVVVWREADESQRYRWRTGARAGVAGMVRGRGGWTATVRIVAGSLLVASGLGLVLLRGGSFDQMQFALLAVLATLVGVAVLTVPFWLRMVRDLGEERRARIRTQERAEIAAHLHDSVLQTLALIQKQAEAPREVAKLARGQERQLRRWLYGPSGYGSGGQAADPAESAEQYFAAALQAASAEVEDSFGVAVDQVVVGDTEQDGQTGALVMAAREAMMNAAKHAGVAEISVYAEVEPEQVAVFVRDRGNGFDPERVPEDRRGLIESIHGRMERHGGDSTVRAAPGAGTEVVLTMPRVVTTEGAS
ncbi:phage shock protein C (PspC) family protein [Haloechinothrix alba]|uniref:Phage shock protein C (PspC) family protein n=1 Tax=Haloechinothrix alba TaxID=664784 RepID=A0A238VT95_9PSEU|nr:ATP-binding protein [Haloechinothrix alba]SNR37458.1 phage shock protein C (PspC) family protein [Haloechinothrix alba]